jgi:hypothetical protein
MKIGTANWIVAAFVGSLLLGDWRVTSASTPGWTQWRGPNRDSTSGDNTPWAHLAVSNGDVVVRDLGGVTLFDWPRGTN